MDVLLVFLASLATALATGLGALPLLFMHDASARVVGTSNAIAGGLMLAASMMLLSEGASEGVDRTIIGGVLGAIVVWLIARLMRLRDDHDAAHVGSLVRGASLRTGMLVVAVMTAHSFAEGIGVGVSFGGGDELGLLVTLAIAIHNIPEGLTISLALVPAGASVRAAAGWSIFSSLPQAIVAVPAFLFVEQFSVLLPYGLGAAAGAMLWMVVFELIPEAVGRARLRDVAAGLAAGFALMAAVTQLIGY